MKSLRSPRNTANTVKIKVLSFLLFPSMINPLSDVIVSVRPIVEGRPQRRFRSRTGLIPFQKRAFGRCHFERSCVWRVLCSLSEATTTHVLGCEDRTLDCVFVNTGKVYTRKASACGACPYVPIILLKACSHMQRSATSIALTSR